MTSEPHSKQFLTDERDTWWRAAQLREIATHLDLANVRDVIDVGAGQGHWTRTIAALAPQASIVGVEREAEWVERATERGGARYALGTAEQLPFADASVDLVTAQTLLIHVRDPAAVLREMARVLRPGGKLWLVEPNNVASCIAAFADPSTDPAAMIATFQLEVVCERGKHALGLGYNSLGETLVGLLARETWRDIDVRLCDRVACTTPAEDHDAGEIVTWPRDETLRYWLAGGGDPGAFDELWRLARALKQQPALAVAGGVLLYSYTATRN